MYLTKELNERLGRFGRYLLEYDVEYLVDHGNTLYHHRREAIDKTHSMHFWPLHSELTRETAQVFVHALGNDLQAFALHVLDDEKKRQDWHHVVDVAEMCELGWMLVSFGEEFF